jgi:hypothetical protein
MIIQINDETREATADDLALLAAIQETDDVLAATQAEQEAARQSARTKLAALGLTDAEIAALVGA